MSRTAVPVVKPRFITAAEEVMAVVEENSDWEVYAMAQKEKRYLTFVSIFGGIGILLSVMDLVIDFYIPGLSPIINAIFWFFLWKLFQIRKQITDKFWAFLYLFIVILNLVAGISQIINAVT